MHCRNCGKECADQAIMCVSCGCPPHSGVKYCQNCGGGSDPSADICIKCGVRLTKGAPADAKSKLAAGLLGIFLGGIGVHRFYLGFVGMGIIQIIVTTITFGFGAIWGLIEGILLLTGSMDKDAKGNLLKD